MHPALRLMERRFLARVQAPRWWGVLAYKASRPRLALAIASLPALAALAAVAWAPEEVAKALTSTQNVHRAFARFISAVATASAIAVSIAALTLRRELRGLGKQERRHEANQGFRRRVREAADVEDAPLGLAPFVGTALAAVAASARRARQVAARADAPVAVEGLALDDYLAALERRASGHADRLHRDVRRPNDIAEVALDFEFEVTSQLARRYARLEAVDEDLRAALDDLEERLADLIQGIMYVKTLDTQWGFSRMSTGTLLTAFPAIFVAAGMVLAYGDGAVAALGVVGAGAIVAAALFAVALPLAVFMSYLLRFVFLNQYTLPTDAFILGPEEPGAMEQAPAGQGPRRGAGRST